MAEKILITGGTGNVGSRLICLLKEKGYEVHVLSRRANHREKIFAWDPASSFIEAEAFEGVTKIIHLAGAAVVDGRWTAKRKKDILDSRVLSTVLLRQYIKEHRLAIDTFVGASATGYYGSDTGDEVQYEETQAGKDFLANVCVEWEKEEMKVADLGIRTVILRTGIVLSEKGGALEKIAGPVKLGLGAAFASGKQWMPWIHADDLCQMYIYALENEKITGVYNAVAPNPVTNAGFTKEIADVLKKPLILPNVPAFALKLALGEMAAMVNGGNRVSSGKIQKEGFIFAYPNVGIALNDLLK